MTKIAWITDSSCGLPESFIKEHDIHVLPLNVILNDISYREDIEITKDEFYEQLKVFGEGAKTSQPAYGEFLVLYEDLKNKYDYGIAIHASSALTGTYQSSMSAAKEVDFKVEVIDSKMGAFALGKMIRNGLELEKSGKTFDEIVQTLRTYPDRSEMYLLPSSLEQLKKSGRVSTPQALLASLLNINILLKLDNGKVTVDEKIRSKKRAKKRLFQIIEQAVEKHQIKELCVMHAGVKDIAQTWKNELKDLHKNLKVKIETLVPVAGVHTGFGTMAISWLLNDQRSHA